MDSPALCAESRRAAIWCLVTFAASVVGLFAAPAQADVVAQAADSQTARQDAIATIPFDQMNDGVRNGLADVINRSSFYRRLPAKRIQCDPDMYLFLVRNPDVVVNIWEIMGATSLQLARTNATTFAANDGAGTTSTLQLVYGTPQLHILYADSLYDGPLLARPVKTRTVMVLRSHYGQDEHGLPQVTNTMDVFVRIDHLAANLLARTMSGLVTQTADTNFVETVGFLERLSKTAGENAPGVQDLATRLERVSQPVQQRFSAIAGQVGQRAQKRAATPIGSEESAQAPTTATDAARTGQTQLASTAGRELVVPFEPRPLRRRSIRLRR